MKEGGNRVRQAASNQIWAKHCPKGFSDIGLTATSEMYLIILISFFFSNEESEIQKDQVMCLNNPARRNIVGIRTCRFQILCLLHTIPLF